MAKVFLFSKDNKVFKGLVTLEKRVVNIVVAVK